ncbi:alpha/beta hydrolase [Actinophytocola algeriensis]|uniref:Putative dienelactone hydrolase n=1 Tax=Actinophytocola algeriensis TaxID=1768010 RepID=A0A7W7Q493_9PSEU|nr:esterase [Actinophytocola algeriensis]MBB4906578.1 putative dienelactone hydrolase [Actinophytocola algeriensis]MBE1478059.1 putative dienelactone hydrolase [Actinophytocola algeriensis]
MRTVAVLTALALALALPAAPAAADPGLRLPAPTGKHPVGTTSLYLKDTSRPDPWVPSVPYRELMVSLFYPATSAHGQKAQYMTPTESRLLLADGELTDLPSDLLSTVRTDAVRDARPGGRPHSLPLVVLSPGHSKPRATLTSLAEDLASHGYVVAVVDHTYENVAQTFPDGRVTTCVTCEMEKDESDWIRLNQGRATDVSFVLDELLGRWRQIDPARIVMGGHSAGGASSIPALLTDPRINAGFDIDGSTYDIIPESGLAKPFLFLGRAEQYTPGSGNPADTWDRSWAGMTGWKRWLLVDGAKHVSFTDVGILLDQMNLDTGATITADRTQAITRTYVRAFLDLHLRGRSQPLLDEPSPRYPEVTLPKNLSLPHPTGRRPVGSTSLHLKDTSRPDTWVPEVPYRELMVSLFYPTATTHGTKTQYVTAAESAALLADGGLTDLPPDLLTTVRTNSVRNARMAGHHLPLVVLSPGYTKPRATLTALAEDLASNGYVVAVVGHTYENYGTSFPDGRFLECASCAIDHLPGFWEKLAQGRAKDVSFVLDELLGKYRRIDPARIAMGGHSAGGGSATTALVADDRIKAGFDIDGRAYLPLSENLDRPFLYLIKYPTVDATRVQAITRAYLGAFLDQNLKGEERPLLAAPSPEYPEITFCA